MCGDHCPPGLQRECGLLVEGVRAALRGHVTFNSEGLRRPGQRAAISGPCEGDVKPRDVSAERRDLPRRERSAGNVLTGRPRERAVSAARGLSHRGPVAGQDRHAYGEAVIAEEPEVAAQPSQWDITRLRANVPAAASSPQFTFISPSGR